jgi:hypothetical protein
MTDLLERDLRAANPLHSRRTDPLSARAEADLASILASTPAAADAAATVVPIASAPKKIRRARFAWALSAAAALVVASVITIASLTVSPPAGVAAPPDLDPVPIDSTLSEVLAEMSANARQLPGDTSLGHIVESEAWYSDITIGEESTTYFVQPQLVHLEWNADYSGFVETRAGEVRWGDPVDTDGMAEPGELLSRYDYPEPGTFPMGFPQPPPDTADAFRDYIRATYTGFDDATPAASYFAALEDIRGTWPLTGPQAAGALDFIGTLPDVELLGEVVDRLGRTGIAVATETETHRLVLVFDRSTGLLLSAETSYLGGIPDFDYPPGVMGFTAWKEP